MLKAPESQRGIVNSENYGCKLLISWLVGEHLVREVRVLFIISGEFLFAW